MAKFKNWLFFSLSHAIFKGYFKGTVPMSVAKTKEE